jgi:hypothetical protein
MGNTAMRLALRSAFIATAILVSASIAPAQTAKPPKPPELFEVNQLVGIKRADLANYDVSLRLENGSIIDLRMSTFVLQDLSRVLGNFNR